MGRSIGSGVATELAVKYSRVRALILISAFTSLCDVVKEWSFDWVGNLVRERFRNLDKMKMVNCPKLMIHGRNDRLIPKEHSEKLHEACGKV